MVPVGCPHRSLLLGFNMPAALGPSTLGGGGRWVYPWLPMLGMACCPAWTLSLGQSLPAWALLSTWAPGQPWGHPVPPQAGARLLSLGTFGGRPPSYPAEVADCLEPRERTDKGGTKETFGTCKTVLLCKFPAN